MCPVLSTLAVRISSRDASLALLPWTRVFSELSQENFEVSMWQRRTSCKRTAALMEKAESLECLPCLLNQWLQLLLDESLDERTK